MRNCKEKPLILLVCEKPLQNCIAVFPIPNIGVFFVRGAYLYRRERKKGGSTSAAGAGPAKRTRHGFSDDGSSTSTQPDGKYNHNLQHTQGEAIVISVPESLLPQHMYTYYLIGKRLWGGRLSVATLSDFRNLIGCSFVEQ